MDKVKLKRLKQVIQTEATTSAIGDFLATHIPFTNLYFQEERKRLDVSIGEEKLYREILLQDAEDHKFIMINGYPGSGKSHLIRWLKERYKSQVNSSEAVLFISKAHNTLQDALEQILEADIFPVEIKENELKNIRSARSNISSETLKMTINYNFVIEIDHESDLENKILDKRFRKWLSVYLKDDYIIKNFLMVDGGPLDRIKAKLQNSDNDTSIQNGDPLFTPDDFKISIQQISQNLNIAVGGAAGDTISLAEKLADERSGSQLRKDIADYLNTKVASVIQMSMKLTTTDFKNLFSSLRKILKQQNMTLTLFIEDITSFVGLDEALMEVLITNHQAEGNQEFCRLISVCGATSDFHDHKIPDNIMHRITHSIKIVEESILGSKRQLAIFTAKYINAINLSETQISEWMKQGAVENLLPIASVKSKWSSVEYMGKNYSIFPFNETAIWNQYQALDSDNRTPRLFLKNVILSSLTRWYINQDEFLIDESNFIQDKHPIPRWININYNNSNKQIDLSTATQRSILLRLWGDATTEVSNGMLGGLSTEVFDDFHIVHNILGIPNTISQVQEPAQEPILEKPAINIPTERSKDYKKFENEIIDWYENNTALINHIELRTLLMEFIKSSINWEIEGVNEMLVNAYISSIKRVHIERQDVNIGDGFVLTRNEKSMHLLIALVAFKYLGINTWRFDSGEDYLVSATAWIIKNKASIVSLVKSPSNESYKWNLPLWHVASLYYIQMLFSQFDITQPDELMMVNLLDRNINFDYATYHSEAWNSMKKAIINNDDHKKLIDNSISFFSKSIGSSTIGATRYSFVDAHEILKQISILKSIKWDLSEMKLELKGNNQDLWYASINFINELSVKIEKALTEEEKLAENYLTIFNDAFGEECDENLAKNSIEEINSFLLFLTNSLNSNYNASDYYEIQSTNAYSKLYKAIIDCRKLNNIEIRSLKLNEFAKNPFDSINKFNLVLISLNKLIESKRISFNDGIDENSIKLLNEMKGNINREVDYIQNKIQEFGGLE